MIKIRQRETKTNLIYFYVLSTAASVDELGLWLSRLPFVPDLEIEQIQVIDSSERNSEGSGSIEIDVRKLENELAGHVRKVHADYLSIPICYKGTNIMIGIDLDEWQLSTVAYKKDGEVLDELETVLTAGLGMFYYDIWKISCGKVDVETFFKNWNINTFGYYQNVDGTWIGFVTDDERGIECERHKVPTEEAAAAWLSDHCESCNFAHFENVVIEHFEEKAPFILEHLKRKCGYSDEKARKTLDYLLQVKVTAFEYWYFLNYGCFVPDKYANKHFGWTAKRIAKETVLTDLGAFNYMIYLKQQPEEAIRNLEKGLPRK